jgi:hypothetical protein
LPSRFQTARKSGQRHKQSVRRVLQRHSTITGVPLGRLLVLGVDDENHAANFGRGSDATPGRSGIAGWTDSSGNLWFFGGGGLDAGYNAGSLNDLWEYQP